MIKKIICPTDFSPAAQNGAQYAAKLAQLTGAQLYFVNVVELTPLEATATALSGKSARVSGFVENTKARLEELCRDVNSLFGVNADYEVDAGAAPFHQIFSGTSRQDTLLVSGTNGADDLTQRLFGSASYRMLKNWDGPALIVPENVSYGTVKKIVYAWGERFDRNINLDVLKDFASLYNPTLVCLHMVEGNELPGAEVYEQLRRNMQEIKVFDQNILYERMDSGNRVESLQEFMSSHGADMLVINHGHFGDRFTSIKKLVAQTHFPLLIIPA